MNQPESQAQLFQAFQYTDAFDLQNQLDGFQKVQHRPATSTQHTIYEGCWFQNVITALHILPAGGALVEYEQVILPDPDKGRR